jgi:superfamily II DNA or RNA helicase
MACTDRPPPPTLRPYQEADLARIRAAFANGARRICYQGVTGSSKTRIFAAVVAGAALVGIVFCDLLVLHDLPPEGTA